MSYSCSFYANVNFLQTLFKEHKREDEKSIKMSFEIRFMYGHLDMILWLYMDYLFRMNYEKISRALWSKCADFFPCLLPQEISPDHTGMFGWGSAMLRRTNITVMRWPSVTLCLKLSFRIWPMTPCKYWRRLCTQSYHSTLTATTGQKQ